MADTAVKTQNGPEQPEKMNRAAQCGAQLIHFRFPGVPGVNCLFTTALFGNISLSEELDAPDRHKTVERRNSLLKMAGVSRWAELKQVHGTEMLARAVASDVNTASTLEADGHATEEKDLALAVKTADCQPVLLTHVSGKFVAALHVGWRGNANGFIEKAVRELCTVYAVNPGDLCAVRGPSLGPGASRFTLFAQEWGPNFSLWYDAHQRTVDLWRLTHHQLCAAGLREKSIFSLDLCTYSLPEIFFSHRQKHTGRQVALIWKE